MSSNSSLVRASLDRLGRDSPFARRILAVSLASFALLIAAGLAAIYLANRTAEAENWIVHSMNVRRGARALLVELLNAETGARGYALTEDESFLEPYNRASPRMQGLIDELVGLYVGQSEPADQDRRRSGRRWMQGWKSSTASWR